MATQAEEGVANRLACRFDAFANSCFVVTFAIEIEKRLRIGELQHEFAGKAIYMRAAAGFTDRQRLSAP